VKVRAGKSFAELAKQLSSDEFSKKRGGLLGWRKKGFTGYLPGLDDRLLASKKGAIVGPERTDRGFELILVEDLREGDVPFEVAVREIAEEKVEAERANAKSKAEAEALITKLK